jgi:hypothetical protein
MTRDQAQSRCAEHNAHGGDGHWIARQVAPGEWRALRLRAPGLKPVAPEGTRTEERPRPDYADDPRTANMRNVPPFGGGA